MFAFGMIASLFIYFVVEIGYIFIQERIQNNLKLEG